MPLSAGTRLGPYEIVALIGAGGMGEVYRARDPRMGREVAIKVSAERFSDRFEREVHAVAALNHPNICHIYDVGPNYLVMELVEGPTLADRIKEGALPLEQALPVARQIAGALEAAHEKGITHRDLKPANIKIKPDGMVKVLDFGLAKMAEPATSAENPDFSPTLSIEPTRAGQILGTAAYMAPEQARGKLVDKRTDIWSFGCVLYEALTGRQAFGGETVSDTIAGILGRDADCQALPAGTPAKVVDLLRRCLQKDAKLRLHDIADARIEIEEALDPSRAMPVIGAGLAEPRATRRTQMIIGGLAVLAALSIGVALWALLRAPSSPTRPIARLVITLPPADRLALGYLPAIAFAPDGSRLVYVANRGASTQLYVRAVDRFEAAPLPGTEGAESPFFSPDGQSVGFFAGGKLKKVSLSGGAPLTLCSAAANRGASWGPDGTIIFTPAATSGLFEIAAAGGTPKPLTVPDHKKGEISHRWPEILPGGKALLFTLWSGGSFDDARIVLLSLETGERRVLVEGSARAQYVPSGHLVYARAGGLLAVPFDLKRLEVRGSPVSILEGVSMNPTFGSADFSASADGSLVYIPGGSSVGDRTLLWVDRKGAARPLPAPPRAYVSPRLCPDGQRLAVGSEGTGVWLYDLARGTLTRLTETAGALPLPIWTPDGKHVTFRSTVTSSLNLHWMPADGSGVAERLTTSENMQSPGSWSPDGQVLAFSESDLATGWDIWVLKLEGDRKQRPFLQTPFNEGAPMFSPDGRWLVYQSDESGRQEIYVRPFPGPGGKMQISTEGGTEPVWPRNGQELFYRNGDRMMAVTVETKPAFAAAKPKLLFEGHYERGIPSFYFQPDYDVSPDGQRFLMIKPSEQETAATQVNLVLNWSDELRRLAPGGK